MLNNLLTVGTQVAIMFAMIAAGFILYKTRLVNDEATKGMTNALMWLATPCLIVDSFSREFERSLAASMGVFAIAALIGTALAAVLSTLLFRRCGERSRAVMINAGTFSNCGFMGVPLAQALFGAPGVMFASIFVAVFNLTQWTYGYALLSGKGTSARRLLVNPGVIGLAVGLPLFFFSVTLPGAVAQTLESFASLNTPLAMIVIGCYLARTDLLRALRDGRVYAVSLVRLLLAPALAVLLTWLLPLPLDAVARSVLCIELATPCAATMVLISAQCERDVELAGRCVAVTTLLSVITLPVTATVCQALFE